MRSVDGGRVVAVVGGGLLLLIGVALAGTGNPLGILFAVLAAALFAFTFTWNTESKPSSDGLTRAQASKIGPDGLTRAQASKIGPDGLTRAQASKTGLGGLTPGQSTFKILTTSRNRSGYQNVTRAWFDTADIERMPGPRFEVWVAEGLRRQGWHVEITQNSGDYGVDLVATKDGKRTAVQVKRYTKPCNIGAVQEVVAGAIHWKCPFTMVVTSAPSFTTSAQKLAALTGTKLISGRELKRWR